MKRPKEVFWYVVDNQIARRISFFAQLLLVIAVTYVLVRKFEMLDNQSTASVFNNSICSTPPPPPPSPSSPFAPPALCSTSQSFSKFLFFYCDGLARDLAEPVLDVFEGHFDIVRILNEGFPASYAVFTSFMTGKLPTNYLGSPILTDSLPFQFKTAGFPMWFYGTKMPAYDVLEKGDFFDQHLIEYVNPATSTLYEQLFQCGQNSSICAPEFLNNAKATGHSVMFSGDVVDERNHLTGNKRDPQTLEIIKKFANDFQYVKKWVDDNPEYLLILVSDHGGKRPSDAGAHGVNDGGNEAFMAFYNPSLSPLPQEEQDAWIDTVDVCPTIWQFFAGAGLSIPAESCGKVRAMYASLEDRYRLLKLNAMQMRAYAKWWGYSADEKTYKRAIAQEAQGNLEQALDIMEQYVDGLKKPLLELKKFPLFEVVTYPFAIVIIIAFIVWKQYGTRKRFKSEVFSSRFPALIATHFSFIFFSAMFSGYWVLWWWDTNQNIHIYGMIMLSCMTMYYSTNPPEQKTNNDGKKYIELHKLVVSSDSANECSSEEELGPDSPAVVPDSPSVVPEETAQTTKPQLTTRRCSIAYLIGNTRIGHQDPQKWVFRYCVASFFMGVSIQVLGEPLEGPLFTSLYKFSYLYVAIALWWEFVWQRRLLISHLVGPAKNEVVVYPARHRVFWPLYMKIVVYFVLFTLMYIYDRQWAQGVMNTSLAFAIYGIIFSHAIVLLFCNPHIQRDLAVTVLALLFFLCNVRERFYLVAFVMPQYHCLSNLFYSRFEPANSKITSKFVFKTGAADHFLPLSVLLMINTCYWNFQVMRDTFSIGDVAVYVPGVMDPPTSPMFSAFIMGFHKMGYFFLLGAYLIRLVAPCPPALLPHPSPMIGHFSAENNSSTRQRDSMKRYVWAFLMFFQLVSAFFFHLGYYNFVLTKTFVWTMTVSIIVITFGIPVATSYLGDYFWKFLGYVWWRFVSKRSPY
eukprot:Phypoly_transcript_02033.p1 GENE.Phypoly_transcript_02033~~Phypoly_transcript_02033.p1  ORF type:complete len:965 (+),score=148.31 Phypoly_transcript_02033:78-2972(+)